LSNIVYDTILNLMTGKDSPDTLEIIRIIITRPEEKLISKKGPPIKKEIIYNHCMFAISAIHTIALMK